MNAVSSTAARLLLEKTEDVWFRIGHLSAVWVKILRVTNAYNLNALPSDEES